MATKRGWAIASRLGEHKRLGDGGFTYHSSAKHQGKAIEKMSKALATKAAKWYASALHGPAYVISPEGVPTKLFDANFMTPGWVERFITYEGVVPEDQMVDGKKLTVPNR